MAAAMDAHTTPAGRAARCAAVLTASALAILLVPSLAGCLECQPLLEVRHCLPDKCDPSPDAQHVDWSAQDAADWPDVDALMRRTEEGSHEHTQWTREREQALWADYGVAGEQRELHVTLDGETYRIRVLTCD